MRTCFIYALLFVLACTSGRANPSQDSETPKKSDTQFDYSALGKIPVQNDGRLKPLDSLVRESIWIITGKSTWVHRDFQDGRILKKYSPFELFLAIQFGTLDWQNELLISCSYEPLLEKLQIPTYRLHCSYKEVFNNEWFRSTIYTVLKREEPEVNIDKPVRSKLESEAMDLYRRYTWLQALGEGSIVMIVPNVEKMKPWLSIRDSLPYSKEIEKDLQSYYQNIGESWKKGDTSAFQQNAENLAKLLKTLQPSFYPPDELIAKEYTYNKVSPFQKALLFYILAMFCYFAGFKWKRFKLVANILLVVGFVIHSWGIWQRVIIGGRAPVSNMYESMIFFGWSAIVFGMVFELVYRTGICGLSAAVCGTAVQIITDNVSLNPNLPVLEPVLNSIYLTYHVLLIMVSYAAFGVSLVFSHFYIFVHTFKPQNKELLKNLDTYNYRIIQLGCVGISFGIFLGAVWANESWGRYWAWDPKETWALITFLSYLSILHGRFTNWWKAFGSSVGSILSFGVLLMTYYGVNFFLVGKHSYAGASADNPLPTAIIIYIVAEVAILLIGWWAYQSKTTTVEKIQLEQ